MDLDTWQQVFTAQVRGIQNLHPKAHRILLNWAAWSRDIGQVPGLTNHLYPPSFWDQFDPASCDRDGWGEADAKTPRWNEEALADSIRALMKPEPKEKEEYDAKAGEAADIVLHHTDLPAIWRRIAKTVYFWRGLEYKYPQDCRLSPEDFLMHLDGLLMRLEGGANP